MVYGYRLFWIDSFQQIYCIIIIVWDFVGIRDLVKIVVDIFARVDK